MPQASKAPARRPDANSAEMVTRLMPVSTVDADQRSAECTWTTGAQVRRYDYARDRMYIEDLGGGAGVTVRMDRLASGSAPLLNCHSSWGLGSVLGVVDRADLDQAKGTGTATLRFSKREEVEPYFQDVRDKILRNVSVGARVYRYEMIAPGTEGNTEWIYRAMDWEPVEISLVPVGADAGAVIRSADGSPAEPIFYPCEFVERGAGPQREASASQRNLGAAMPDATNQPGSTAPAHAPAAVPPVDTTRAEEAARQAGVTAERERQREIRDTVRAAFTLTDRDQLAEDYIARGVSVDAVRADVLRRMSEANDASQVRGQSHIETVRDEGDVRRAAMSDALLHRIGVQRELNDAARQYRGLTLREMARESIEAAGISTRGMDIREIAGMAIGLVQRGGYNTTSDLPVVLGGVVGRTMRQTYQAAPRSFTSWARRGTLTDFRPVSRIQVDGAVKLEKVNESGEYKYGTLTEGGETIKLGTYGKVVAITRQMIINDDLSALDRIPQFFGRAAANLESDIVYGVLLANPAMNDGKKLFSADHKNLGQGAAISIDALSAGRAAMRVQTAPGDGSPLNLAPKFLIVPAALETVAGQFTSNAFTPNDPLKQNPFYSTLTPIVEPRLDAAGATQWILAADPAMVDTVEYCYLEGEEGLYTEQWVDFDVDGLKVKGRLDFAAKAIDYRGLYKNAGA